MVPAGNKAKRLSLVNHSAKTIYHPHLVSKNVHGIIIDFLLKNHSPTGVSEVSRWFVSKIVDGLAHLNMKKGTAPYKYIMDKSIHLFRSL